MVISYFALLYVDGSLIVDDIIGSAIGKCYKRHMCNCYCYWYNTCVIGECVIDSAMV